MHGLKSLVYKLAYPSAPDDTYTKLISALRKQKAAIQKEDREKGRITVRCLSIFINVILWRCWSDELVIEVKKDNALRTNVSFYAVPNLCRF